MDGRLKVGACGLGGFDEDLGVGLEGRQIGRIGNGLERFEKAKLVLVGEMWKQDSEHVFVYITLDLADGRERKSWKCGLCYLKIISRPNSRPSPKMNHPVLTLSVQLSRPQTLKSTLTPTQTPLRQKRGGVRGYKGIKKHCLCSSISNLRDPW